MKSVDLKDIDSLPGKKLRDNDTFIFCCHSGLECFNRCCRNLNLFLYPYDVICLKKNLGITSDEFLDRYTDVVMRPGNFFPDILLRMADNEEKTCPFLTESGCSVYSDRPDTCRTFPVEHGVIFNASANKAEPVYFFRPPDFCRGQYENRELTLKEWALDQNALKHNKLTALWADLKAFFNKDPWGPEGPEGARGKMAFMSTYNSDQFRNFIFNSSFLKRYKIKSTLLKKIKVDDTELMKFGFLWVKYYIWGIQTKIIKLR
ncbi:MAG: YkgJ family cysteine cluster protein [Deltaproteobacteria bacterium]|nr:YkgJ family cysteine cluster protein [Deltaproteobacteria bacterium]